MILWMQTFAVLMAISGVVVCGLALAAERLLRHRSPPLRYGVLFAGVLALPALPALVGVGQSLSGLFAVTTEETVRIPAEQLLDLPAQSAPAVPIEPAPVGSTGVGVVVVVSWAIGSAIGLFGLVRGLWTQRRAFVAELWQPEWWTDERRRALAEKVGVRRFPAVCRSPFAPLPMVLGLWRPRIVLPESAPSTWSQSQWEAVLLHEAAHIARRDPWAVLGQRLAVVLFWWCPLVYRLSHHLDELRETICDDYALEGSCDRVAYAELLVETAERLVHLRTGPGAVGLLDSARDGLEKRITRLLGEEKRPMTRLSLVGKLFGAAVLMVGCLSITAATALSQAPAPQKKVQIKIIIDGKEIDLSDEVIQSLLEAKKQPAPPAKAPVVTTGSVRLWDLGDDAAFFRRVMLDVTGALPTPEEVRAFLADKNPDKRSKKFDEWARVVRVWQAKSDPRIEELVKQAEIIKPGSGAAVRKALEGGLLVLEPQDKVETVVKRAHELMLRSVADPKHEALEKRLDALMKELEELRREIRTSKPSTPPKAPPPAREQGSLSPDGKLRATPFGGAKPASSLAFSPDGKLLTTGEEDVGIRIWDTSTGKLLRQLTGAKGPIITVTFSPDGKTLTIQDANHKTSAWDVATGKQILVK
jgi:beta-lactamase regulating signal transducer with metallopeptidase domain